MRVSSATIPPRYPIARPSVEAPTKTLFLNTAGDEKIWFGSLGSLSQFGASGLPQITFFQTREPSAAFRQYTVLPAPK